MNEQWAWNADVAVLSCCECKVPWVDPSERWRGYLTDDDPAELVIYCHLCATREFGPWADAAAFD